MQDHNPQDQPDLGFFKPSGFHIGGALLVIALSVIAFLPFSFTTLVGGTTLVNYILVAIMIVSLFVLILDLAIHKNEVGGGNDA